MENIKDINVQEAKTPKEKNTNSFELPTENIQGVAEQISSVGDKILHDKAITESGMKDLENSIQDLESDLDLANDIPIWLEMRNGVFDHSYKVTYITDEIAKILSKNNKSLLLFNLRKFSDKAAEYLGQNIGDILWIAPKHLSDLAIRHLSKHAGVELDLGELESISDKAAEYLSRYRGERLALGLTAISENAAKSLSKYHGTLFLEELKTLSDEAAKYLGPQKCEILMRGLESISDVTAEFFSHHEGDVALGIRSITDVTAEYLSRIDGENLHLTNLASISDTAAEHLSKFKGLLGLDGLTTLSDVAARHLAKHANTSLHGLENISNNAAKSFARGEIPFVSIKKIEAQIFKFKKRHA